MPTALLIVLLAATGEGAVQSLMETAFYPVLLGVLVIASLGLPIPEDVPLIAAGVILRTQPGAATWFGACLTALIGIMTGDLVLYSMGRRWGRDVVRHRWVRSLITADRFDVTVARFHRWGAWMCFFGRFFMGIRAVMCITAGATRFPYWRFFLADFAGALLSVPFFIWLGWHFADMLPLLQRNLGRFQEIAVALLALLLVLYVLFEWRRFHRTRRINLGQNGPSATMPAASLGTPAAPAEGGPPVASAAASIRDGRAGGSKRTRLPLQPDSAPEG